MIAMRSTELDNATICKERSNHCNRPYTPFKIQFRGTNAVKPTLYNLPRNTAGLGFNPKHIIYALIVKFCTIFGIVLRKRTKINNKDSVRPILEKQSFIGSVPGDLLI